MSTVRYRKNDLHTIGTFSSIFQIDFVFFRLKMSVDVDHHRMMENRPNANDSKNTSEDDGDPFKSSDRDSDPDYELPSKRIRVEKGQSSGISKKSHTQKKNMLSARERIARLNDKWPTRKATSTALKSKGKATIGNKVTTAQKDFSAHSSTRINVGSNNENDADGKNGAAGIQTASSKTDMDDVLFKNHDDLFDRDNFDDGFDKISDPYTIKEPSDNFMPPHNSYIRDCLLELIGSVNALRKQVARLEMKSIGGPSGVLQDEIQPDFLIDFEDSLTREGLPITTCVELNDFELRLRKDGAYRKKMVFAFYMDYFLI